MFLYNQDITKTYLMESNARHCGVPTNALNTVVWSAEVKTKYKITHLA